MIDATSSKTKGPLLRLAVLTTEHTLYDDMGRMVTDTLEKMGLETCLYQKIMEGMESWPAILIIGDTSLLKKCDSFFRSLGDKKPLILFWYLEQLGPGTMSATAKKLGKRLAACYWPEILPLGLGCFFRSHQASQKPRTNYVIHLIRNILAYRLKKQIERDCGHQCLNLDGNNLFYMMYRARDFAEHFKNPWVDRVFTSAPSRQEHLEQLDIPAEFIPVGWHPIWGQYNNLQRDIDIVFIGNIQKRWDYRGRIIQMAQKQLAAKGYAITITDRNCFGQTRTDLLNRSKIVLDIVRAPWEIPGMRLLIAMSCGALVVSCGFAGNAGPYRAGAHFIEAGPEKLTETLLYYLKNEDQRKTIADAGRLLVTETVTMEKSLCQMLNLAAKAR